MTVVAATELDFKQLSGRASANPFAGFDPGDLSVRVVIVEEAAERNLHLHPLSPEVIFVAEGDGVTFVDGSPHRVSGGDVVWIPAQAPHASVPLPGSRLKLACFFPHGDLSANLVELAETVSLENME